MISSCTGDKAVKSPAMTSLIRTGSRKESMSSRRFAGRWPRCMGWQHVYLMRDVDKLRRDFGNDFVDLRIIPVVASTKVSAARSGFSLPTARARWWASSSVGAPARQGPALGLAPRLPGWAARATAIVLPSSARPLSAHGSGAGSWCAFPSRTDRRPRPAGRRTRPGPARSAIARPCCRRGQP